MQCVANNPLVARFISFNKINSGIFNSLIIIVTN